MKILLQTTATTAPSLGDAAQQANAGAQNLLGGGLGQATERVLGAFALLCMAVLFVRAGQAFLKQDAKKGIGQLFLGIIGVSLIMDLSFGVSILALGHSLLTLVFDQFSSLINNTPSGG